MAAAVGGGYLGTFKAWAGSAQHSTATKIVRLVEEQLRTHPEIIKLGNDKGWSGYNVTIRLAINFGQDNLIAQMALLLLNITHYETYQRMIEQDKVDFRNDVANRVVVELLKTLQPEHGVSAKSGTSINATITMIPLQVKSIEMVLREAAKTAKIHNQYFDREATASGSVNDPLSSHPPVATISLPVSSGLAEQHGSSTNVRVQTEWGEYCLASSNGRDSTARRETNDQFVENVVPFLSEFDHAGERKSDLDSSQHNRYS